MNITFLTYLLLQLDTINTALGFFGALGTLIGAVFFIAGKVEDIPEILNPSYKLLKVAIPCLILSIFLPSSKNMAIIVGTSVAYEALTSETGNRVINKSVQLLEKEIDKTLEKNLPTGDKK